MRRENQCCKRIHQGFLVSYLSQALYTRQSDTGP